MTPHVHTVIVLTYQLYGRRTPTGLLAALVPHDIAHVVEEDLGDYYRQAVGPGLLATLAMETPLIHWSVVFLPDWRHPLCQLT